MRDTIAAIATATGGGVGMVRLSGPQALAVAGRVFRPMNPAKSPETMPGYTGAFGRVCHGEQLLDEAVLFVYHAPHSYTGEDVAEFCCHGGEFVLSQVLAAVIAAGARPAEAGEYTRRALMNGRMTLTEAESVIDILAAQNTQSLRAALGAMEGALHREVLAVADTLTDCCAHISASPVGNAASSPTSPAPPGMLLRKPSAWGISPSAFPIPPACGKAMIPSNRSGWSAAAARWNSATSFWRSLMKAVPSPPKNANGSRSFRAAPPSSSIISRISPPLSQRRKKRP